MKLFLFIIVATSILACSESDSRENETSGISDNYTVDYDDGKFLGTIETVQRFINALGESDFKKAYHYSRVQKWGSYEDFSSKSAFGAITGTKIFKIEAKPSENGKQVIYAEVRYSDATNGDKTFKQYFYLKEFDNQPKIVDMKLKKAGLSITGKYIINTERVNSNLQINKISGNKYSFKVLMSGLNCADDYEHSGTFKLSGNNGYYTGKRDGAENCKLTFKFSRNSVSVIDNCYTDGYGSGCSFAGKYKKK